MMSGNQHAAGQLSQAQMAQQQQAQIQSNELAKRRSRKPTDRAIPDGVDQNIVNPDAVQRYKELRNIERLLDSTITRKRLDVLESAQRSSKVCVQTLVFFSSWKQRLTFSSNTKLYAFGYRIRSKTKLGKAVVSMLMHLTSHRLRKHHTESKFKASFWTKKKINPSMPVVKPLMLQGIRSREILIKCKRMNKRPNLLPSLKA